VVLIYTFKGVESLGTNRGSIDQYILYMVAWVGCNNKQLICTATQTAKGLGEIAPFEPTEDVIAYVPGRSATRLAANLTATLFLNKKTPEKNRAMINTIATNART